jgi:hypothetical protein
MPRYFCRKITARGYVEDDIDVPLAGLINMPCVPENCAVDTGLVSADGITIWREPNPVGFGKDDEW